MDGHQIPGVAQPAMQMGVFSGRAIQADLEGKPRPSFRYFDKGDLATIGRMSAVAKVEWPLFKAHLERIFRVQLTWISVHIFFLIGFRNRVAVFGAWIWNYFTFYRGALIDYRRSTVAWLAGPVSDRGTTWVEEAQKEIASTRADDCFASSKLVGECSTWGLSEATWKK